MNKYIRSETIKVDNITCKSCEGKIENKVGDLKGVIKVDAAYPTSSVRVVYNIKEVRISSIYRAIEDAGYGVLINSDEELGDNKKNDSFTLIATVIILLGVFVIINNTIGFNFFPQVNDKMGYGMVFVAGIFTSIHCIAMCGGISLSQCVGSSGSRIGGRLRPSLLYNIGRVISYTALGGVVGLFGSVVSVSIKGKVLISIVAAFFMIIMGLNMLGVTKRLRWIMPSLPKGITSKIQGRKVGKSPFVVGLLNGFMPCGPLQAMQLYALGTGSFFAGALSMFLFSAGTVPLMFIFGAVSSFISGGFTKNLMKVSAMLVIVLGVVMGNRAFAMAGINIVDNLGINASQVETSKSSIKGDYQVVETNLESGKYQPIQVKNNIPLKWTIIATKESLNGCNNEIIIPELSIGKKLQVGENIIEFTPKETGTINYTCWMGMISSKITVE